VLRVVVRGSTSGLSEIWAEVDQSLDKVPTIDEVQGFLADTVGASPPTGSVGPAISQWVVTNLKTGGHTSIGGFIVDLDPFGPISTLRLRPTGPR
jgi:hypothetical protein